MLSVSAQPQKHAKLFPYLLFLTVLFLCLETSFISQWINFYLGDYKVVADRLSVPRAAIPGIIGFLCIQLALHFLYTVMIWLMTRLIGIAFNLPWKQIEKIGFVLWVFGLLTVLLANQHYYPNSKYADMFSVLISPNIGFAVLIGYAVIWVLIFAAVLLGLFRYSRKLFIFFAILSGVLLFPYQHKPMVAGALTKPNIIIIGIDSMRPDFLGIKGQTPHIDEFLTQASVFKDAVTPLARTFPAWVSILTGKYPKTNGMRTDLSDQTKLDLRSSLPALLHKQGYATLFATDESRFSNIDERYGFDRVISPPIGFNDFLLGTFNDFPFSNLIINTRLGKYLFPNSYANRGVFTAYDPNAFIRLLKLELNQPSQQPLFLAIHFCLPHYPYFWGTRGLSVDALQDYRNAVHRVDRQFNDFLTLLSQNHYLDHSIVVLLADHGEAIELPGDRVTEAKKFISGRHSHAIPHFYPPSLDLANEPVNQSAGHGTDILSLTQYRVPLAFRFYHYGQYQPGVIANWVSLLDVKPTLMALLHLTAKNMDGNSLLRMIANPHDQRAQRLQKNDLFIETDFTPMAARTVHPEIHQVLFEGIDYYQIDPVTTRILVRKDKMPLIMATKQYADIRQDWILALYPNNTQQMTPVLVNLKSGHWTTDLTTPFAKASPAQSMFMALKKFYGKDILAVEMWDLTDPHEY